MFVFGPISHIHSWDFFTGARYNFGFRVICHRCSRLRPDDPVAGDDEIDTVSSDPGGNVDDNASASIEGSPNNESIIVNVNHLDAILARVTTLEAAVKDLQDANASLTSRLNENENEKQIDAVDVSTTIFNDEGDVDASVDSDEINSDKEETTGNVYIDAKSKSAETAADNMDNK